jgi:hypothetical protein
MSSYQIEDIKDQKHKVDVLRKHIRKNSNTILDQIELAVNWYSLVRPVEEAMGSTAVIGNRSFKPLLVIKSLILQQIYGLTEFPFEAEVADRKSFQKFLNLQFGDIVPDNDSLAKYKETLEKEGLYDRVFDSFFKQLFDADIIPEQDLLLPSEKKEKSAPVSAEKISDITKEEPLLKEDPLAPENEDNGGKMSVDDMIKEIEDRVKNLYDKKSPAEKKILEKSGLTLGTQPEVKAKPEAKTQPETTPENPVYKKLSQIDETLKQLYKGIDYPKTEEISGKIIDAELEVKNELEQTIEEKTKNIFDKLNEIDERLKNLNSPEVKAQETAAPEPEVKKEESSELLNKLLDIDEKLRQLHTEKAETVKEPVPEKDLSEKEDLYKKLFDSFYNKLMEANLVNEAQEFAKEHEIKHELPEVKAEPKAEEKIEEVPVAKEESLVIPLPSSILDTEPTLTTSETKDEVIEEIQVTETITEEHVEPETMQETAEEEKDTFHDYVLEGKVEKESGKTIPVVMVPKKGEINLRNKKKYPIFNNSNLTEDYELGLRFYKLGFKTSFVNLKTDRRHGNSRIATGEYFPNTFWGSVKQRSRWIAGIAFQNWKIHKWQGSLKTKYFLLRDRKAIFSAIGTFLSYIVLLYFLAFIVTSAMGLNVLSPIVEKNSMLWYLILLTLFFAIVRLFHRFAFTYNWYGLRYAVFSIVRLFFDNVVNFFATIRAIKVFRQTKDTVVWDSTEHY